MFMPMMGSKTGGDFFDAAAYWDFTTDSLTDLNGGLALTFTRASDGTYFDSAGILQTATTNAARFDHDPATGQSLGLLIEEARTNSITYSRTFDDADWVAPSGATLPVVTKDETGLDGVANSASTVDDTDAVSAEGIEQNITIANDSATHVGWVRVKKDNDETRFPELQCRCDNGGTRRRLAMHINTKTGVLTQRVKEGTAESGVIDQGDWWKVWINVTNNTTGNVEFQVQFYPAGATTAGTFDATATGSCIVDQIQTELNSSSPTSDIHTTTTAVTRAASVDSAAVSDSSTLYVSARTGYGAGVVCQIDNGTENERYRIERNASNEIHVIVTDGGVEQANLNLGAVADKTSFKVAARFLANDIAASLDGGAVVTDASATLPTVTTIRFGMDTANDEWNDTIEAGAIWGLEKDNAFLQSITQ